MAARRDRRPASRLAVVAGAGLIFVLTATGLAVHRLTTGEPHRLGALVKLGLPVFCGGGTRPYVALTFDDGPDGQTRSLLRTLRREHARATFFLIGSNAARHPHLVREELAYGAVGDHTWSHVWLPGRIDAFIEYEIGHAQKVLERIIGRPVVLFRPPYGARNLAVDETVRARGMVQVLWNVDSGDASEPSTGTPEHIARAVLARIGPGSIVVMHENITGNPTVKALRIVLPELRRRGLVPVSLPELLTRDPPTLDAVANGVAGCRSG